MSEENQDQEPIDTIEPAFDREAALVMNSPYWGVFTPERDAEREVMFRGIDKANRYEDLKGEAKAIYDRAKAALTPPSPWGTPKKDIERAEESSDHR